MDDVLDRLCLLHHGRNAHGYSALLVRSSVPSCISGPRASAFLYPATQTKDWARVKFPFYFELKIAFVIWLLSPYTKGSSVLYRKFVHPTLSNKEKEIDEYITQARDKSYETMMRVGKRGLNLAANAAVTAAAKVRWGQAWTPRASALYKGP
ncbi:Receptor expression-enhancing protein 2 [Saguinus oedipus]|uniref:Receptor expression-enhancing protein n=1 Tax=Saguinus oedipus TaxID=9490 RepID=A0ABQ9W5G6_SAGOE|nr:Receptor expression-enhancing protein 2 [Saguinus oedipus]